MISWRSRGIGEIPEVFSCEANYSQKEKIREGFEFCGLCVRNSYGIYIKSPKEDVSTT